jgi:hypothetical protein
MYSLLLLVGYYSRVSVFMLIERYCVMLTEWQCVTITISYNVILLVRVIARLRLQLAEINLFNSIQSAYIIHLHIPAKQRRNDTIYTYMTRRLLRCLEVNTVRYYYALALNAFSRRRCPGSPYQALFICLWRALLYALIDIVGNVGS